MKFRLLSIFAFLAVTLVVSHAALPSEDYWKSILPNTEMPKSIVNLLHPDITEEKSSHVGVTKIYYYGDHTPVNQLQNDPNIPLFFLEKDLNYGNKMNIHSIKTTFGSTLLPRKIADAIPFSSNKFPEILRKFSFSTESEEAKAMNNTLKECEEPTMEGEDKYCATSLESMIDFGTSKLGKNVEVIETELEKETRTQQYTIKGARKMNEDNSVVCHRQPYAYVVFYCHAIDNTEAYEVRLVGADGTKVKAAAVCHKDTSAWNPKHLAFQELKVKPGTVPICHFLAVDNILWVTK